MRILSQRTVKSYNKRHRIVHGGSLWSTILNLGKQFVGSQTGQKLLSTAGQYALKEGPGLLGRAWDWIKTKLGVKKPAPKQGPIIEEIPDTKEVVTYTPQEEQERRMVGLGMHSEIVPDKYVHQLGRKLPRTAIPKNLPSESIIAASPDVMKYQKKEFMDAIASSGEGLALPGTQLQAPVQGKGKAKRGGRVHDALSTKNAEFLKSLNKTGKGLQKY